MLLSICIPTYNRGALLAVLVRSVLEALPANLRDRTEVVISDNHSTDETAALVEAACGTDPRVRICSPAQHLPTAEENLCFALSQCQGEFVWTLGDDDAVDAATLATLGRLLEADGHDFLVFNSRAMTYRGLLKANVQVSCLGPRLDIPLLDFVRRTGFWYVLAGFSMSVFRRSFADTEEFDRILKVGRIYAHVIWLIGCFHDKRFAFVNEPLVSYRENRYVAEKSDHWEQVSAREGVFDGALWSTAFLRLVDDLVARGVIDRAFVREVVDRGPEQRFYFPDEMLAHFLRGLRNEVARGKGSVPESELFYLLEWGLVLWSDNIVLLSLIDEAARAKRAGQPVRPEIVSDLAAILESRGKRQWYMRFHRYDAYGYSVFQHGETWFAIRLDSIVAVQDLLDVIDFDGCEDLLATAATEAELLSWLASRPRQPPVPIKDASLALPERFDGDLDTRALARAIRNRPRWTFREWLRLVRALNRVAKRSILKALGLRR